MHKKGVGWEMEARWVSLSHRVWWECLQCGDERIRFREEEKKETEGFIFCKDSTYT